jgi:hypothetical protein
MPSRVKKKKFVVSKDLTIIFVLTISIFENIFIVWKIKYYA